MLCISEWLVIPVNPDKWSSTVIVSYLYPTPSFVRAVFHFMPLFLSPFSATMLMPIPHVRWSTQTLATFVLCLNAPLGSLYSHGYMFHLLKQRNKVLFILQIAQFANKSCHVCNNMKIAMA